MTTLPTPFAPGAVREFLRGQTDFTSLCPADSISTRDIPLNITGPYVTLTAPSNYGIDPMLRRPMVQLDAWVPKWEIIGGDTDPEELAWNIADVGARLIHKARIQTFRNSTWRAEWIDGPITDIDIERGPDNPLFRAIVRVDVKMVVR